YFDLIGLPPPPERVERFVKDSSPKAYTNLIEELLASKQYGERWARHWLDVARYADTGGYETDIYFKNAWRYRDYVIKSFNDDKPYNCFVQEQLAADELWPDNIDLDGSFQVPAEQQKHLEARIGTGLLAADEARRACRLFEKSVTGRPLTSEEEKKRRQLRDALAQAVLNLPEQATSTPNDAWDGLMEIPTATVLGQEQAELVPEVYRL